MATTAQPGQGFNLQQLMQYVQPAMNMIAANQRNSRMTGYNTAPADSPQGLTAQMNVIDQARANENAQRADMAAQSQYGYDPYKKAELDRSRQMLDDYIKMASVYPNAQPTAGISKAAGDVFSRNDIANVGQPPSFQMPNMSPQEAKTQAEIKDSAAKLPGEIDRAGKISQAEIDAKINALIRMSKENGADTDEKTAAFVRKQLGMDGADMTPYQQEGIKQAKAGLVGGILNKTMTDPGLNMMRKVDSREDAENIIFAQAQKYRFDPNDPMIVAALDKAWGPKDPLVQNTVKTPSAILNRWWDPRRVLPGVGYRKPSEQLNAYVMANPLHQKKISELRTRYTDDQIMAYLNQRQGAQNAEPTSE